MLFGPFVVFLHAKIVIYSFGALFSSLGKNTIFSVLVPQCPNKVSRIHSGERRPREYTYIVEKKQNFSKISSRTQTLMRAYNTRKGGSMFCAFFSCHDQKSFFLSPSGPIFGFLIFLEFRLLLRNVTFTFCYHIFAHTTVVAVFDAVFRLRLYRISCHATHWNKKLWIFMSFRQNYVWTIFSHWSLHILHVCSFAHYAPEETETCQLDK